MEGITYRRTNRGTYKCMFCDHKAYKTKDAAIAHPNREHPKEVELAIQKEETRKAQLETSRLKLQADSLRRELEEARKPKPEPEKPKYYDAVIYCSVCLDVLKRGMPKGVLTRDVTCSKCGNRSLHRVTNLNHIWGL